LIALFQWFTKNQDEPIIRRRLYFEMPAEEEREGMRLEGGQMLCDPVEQTALGDWLRVDPIEVLDTCFQ
jgi:hypothetical protein